MITFPLLQSKLSYNVFSSGQRLRNVTHKHFSPLPYHTVFHPFSSLTSFCPLSLAPLHPYSLIVRQQFLLSMPKLTELEVNFPFSIRKILSLSFSPFIHSQTMLTRMLDPKPIVQTVI